MIIRPVPGFLFVSLFLEPTTLNTYYGACRDNHDPGCLSGPQEKHRRQRYCGFSVPGCVESSPCLGDHWCPAVGGCCGHSPTREGKGVLLTGALRPRWSGGSTSTGHNSMVQQGRGARDTASPVDRECWCWCPQWVWMPCQVQCLSLEGGEQPFTPSLNPSRGHRVYRHLGALSSRTRWIK